MTVGFQEQNGYGRGQGITRSEVEQSTSKIDTRPPCKCPSLYWHLATCSTAHKAVADFLATLPEQLPNGTRVEVSERGGIGVYLDIDGAFLSGRGARALARALLVAADEGERRARLVPADESERANVG